MGPTSGFENSPVQKYIFAGCVVCVRIGHLTFIDKNTSNRVIWKSF